ncbi:hypothetical protein VH13_04740 [Corynebacterium ulcerans]|uniref:hypothetical protein n=1 Tax=Corynebacterium ulcerans TaxID=65058 RepID=UPI0006286624|nr:hypothetical protein [Corynebacterium ulcerans]KKO85960.1 hypothetical protein VH13_04740 [Corynebacterium ulcerans]KKO87180.1 hypothetical protein VH15_05270 [Corynebacterium ulcerans]BDV26419.1 hypothetical protein CULTSU28_16670 [Corynebacterium ulcerans]
MDKALWKNDVLFNDTGEALAHVRHDRVVLAHAQIQVSIERRFPTGIVVRGASSSGQRYMLTTAGLSVHRLKAYCGEALYLLDRLSVLHTRRQIVRAGEVIGTLVFSRAGTGQIVLEQRIPTESLAFLSYACRLIDAPREVRS